MPTLKGMYKAAAAGSVNVVTPHHVRWMEMPEADQVYSEEAIAHVAAVLRREYKHPRNARFSPSAMGECSRRVMFGFAGAPQLGFDLDNVEMMDHGTWGHLKWQAEGISMEWMKSGEAWVYDPDLRTGGAMDGVLVDDSVFELKTVGWSTYNKIVADGREPKVNNLLQTETYMYLSGATAASIMYEDRSGGLFHEFRIKRSREGDNRVVRTLNALNVFADNDELPPMLDECEMRQGQVYRKCPFRKICPKASSVSEFGQVT